MIDATVIIAAWNAENELTRSVASALAQQDVTVEVIIVDDASTDGTLLVARGLEQQDPRVRVHALSENGGPSAARNAALDLATGRWVVVLDSDDQMLPHRIADMMACAQHTAADCVFDNLQSVDAAGQTLGPPHLSAPDCPGTAQHWSLSHFLTGNQADPKHPSLGFLKPLISRSYLEKHQIRYDPTLRNGEDFHLVLALLLAQGQLWYLPRAGYLYTRRSGSVSSRLNPDHVAALLRAGRAVLKSHEAVLSEHNTQLLTRRLQRIADLSCAEETLQALRYGRLITAARVFARRPRAGRRLVVQIWAAIRNRFR